MAFLLTPGQWGDAPQMIEVLGRIRVPCRQGGPPCTRPDHLGGDKARSSHRNRVHAASGTLSTAWRIASVMVRPTEYDSHRPRFASQATNS